MGETKRAAYSPGEFSELFGKSQTWGYRQIYAGKVNAITEYGRILIPAKEVERILEKAGIYNGMEKPKQASERVKKLPVEQQHIWRRFVESRRVNSSEAQKVAGKQRSKVMKPGSDPKRSRASVLGKIVKTWGGKATR